MTSNDACSSHQALASKLSLTKIRQKQGSEDMALERGDQLIRPLFVSTLEMTDIKRIRLGTEMSRVFKIQQISRECQCFFLFDLINLVMFLPQPPETHLLQPLVDT